MLPSAGGDQNQDPVTPQEGVGPYCLLAQIVEARAKATVSTPDSRIYWSKCSLNRPIPNEGVSWRWIELAHDRATQ